MNYTEKDIELAKEIVCKFEEFAPYDEIFSDQDEDDNSQTSVDEELDELIKYFKDKGIKLTYETGASKLVFLTPDLPFVIKCGFDGYLEYGYEEDEDGYEYRTDDAPNNWYFDGSESGDYAKDEYEIYKHIEEDGYGEYFAEVELLPAGEYRGYYIQEKCFTYGSLDWETVKRPSQDSVDFVREMSRVDDAYDAAPFSYNWCGMFLEKYEEVAMTDFFHYLYDEDLIDDMHMENYGFKLSTGAPVLIDYSGYRG